MVVDINHGGADMIETDVPAQESEANFDAYFATGAFVLAGALSVQKTNRKESPTASPAAKVKQETSCP